MADTASTEPTVNEEGRLDIRFVQQPSEVREKNRNRQTSGHADECFTCGRGLTQNALNNGWWIHLATDGTLFPATQDVDPADSLDQGWFPVGSECARKIPRTFKALGI